jgi:SpoVK/Ycf46/Vps4 family AAA+-type ATPase
LKGALWFVEDEDAPHVVLLTLATNYGQSSGWHVEIAVPEGERGEAVVRRYFATLEAALLRSASYRGKVLSLEQSGRMDGKGAVVSVHRISAVQREDVILPTRTLDLLERNVFAFAKHRPRLAALGLPVKKGLLFYGPPGTGKTHTIRYLAAALPGHTTLLVTAEQVGLIDHYMTLARLLSPSILVIEDADLIARQREDMNSPCEEVLLNRLLNEMDGLKENAEILFVLTTNRPEALEMALRARPGRIDQAIEFPLPDSEGRQRLAQLYGKGVRLEDGTLAHVVERTAGVSAAFIKELMRRSAQFALERDPEPGLTRLDVDAALDELLFSGGKLNAALLGAVGVRDPD